MPVDGSGSWFSWVENLFSPATPPARPAAPAVPAPSAPVAAGDAVSPSTSTPVQAAAEPTLAEGSRGAAVSDVQKKVGVTPDGIYGSQTESAVEKYQRAHGLTGDGVVGPQTWSALEAPDVSGKPTLAEGSRGADVREVQKKVGVAADGVYGPQTQSAVEQYQRAHGLTADGVVGQETWKSLESAPSGSHAAAHAAVPAAPKPAATATPKPVPAPGSTPSAAATTPPKPATAAKPAAAPASGSAQQLWTGWSDAKRGVNNDLGDTESALHLFYQQHPSLNGQPPADGTPEAKQLKDLNLWDDANNLSKQADPAQTDWAHDDTRSIHITDDDKSTAWAIYSQQHPELGGKQPAKGTPAAADLHAFTRYVAQNKYNATIDQALDAHPTPGIDAKDLKSLLVEESNLDPDIGTNAYGYTGIAQLGSDLASKAKANDPLQAIPIAAKTLHDKAAYLDRHTFADYGQPASNEDRADFILGAYNGGEGTIANSAQDAYDQGITLGSKAGLKGHALIDYANNYATQWQSLLAPATDPTQSPLYQEIPAAWGKAEKYHEIGTYGPDIIQRAEQ